MAASDKHGAYSMSDKQSFILRPAPHPSRELAIQAVRNAQEGYHIRIDPPTRSLEANARLWAMLHEVSEQVVWHGRKLDSESWKHIFTSSLKKMDVVPNLEGTGFVALGLSTSKMSVREMCDLQALIEAFGLEHGVVFHDELETA